MDEEGGGEIHLLSADKTAKVDLLGYAVVQSVELLFEGSEVLVAGGREALWWTATVGLAGLFDAGVGGSARGGG